MNVERRMSPIVTGAVIYNTTTCEAGQMASEVSNAELSAILDDGTFSEAVASLDAR